MQGAQIQIRTSTKIKMGQSTQKLVNNQEEHSQEQEEKEPEQVSFFQLFRFATSVEIILIIVGTICAAAMGVALPAFAILWGDITNTYGGNTNLEDQGKNIMLNFIYIGLGAFAAGWGMFACWMIAGERQSITCRKEYLKSLLRQQIGWFDTINQSELATKFATDCFSFQGAIGEKVSTLIMTLSMFISGFTIAFIYGWLMTLVVLCSLPFIALGGALFAGAAATKDKDQEQQYAQAGGQVEQAISSIKTVKQLNGQKYESDKYANTLRGVTENSTKYGIYLGFGMGTLFFSILASYSLGFWYGSLCVEGASGCPSHLNGGSVYLAGDVLVVFFSVLMAGFNLSQLTPAIKKVAEGKVAASRIFKIIDREPQIKSIEGAFTPTTFKGVFKFQKVSFAYPKDKSKNILNNLNIEINSKSSAFVGESGCGKSTIFQLIMRFYDPDQGVITLDGVNLKDLNLSWLRSQIGYVGQEPVLFATTIRENLLFGKEDATDAEIEEALRKAEAFRFVEKLSNKLETYVGVGGGQMSGGQKQRLAIARALLKNPKVLLLDEATSALDRRNEKLIQSTLNKVAEQKTTITIAHRVKTIMNSDQIFVIDAGKVIQEGKFKDLNRFVNMQIDEEDQETQLSPKKEGLKKMMTIDEVVNVEVEAQKKQDSQEDLKKKEEEELLKKYEDSITSRLFAYASDKKLLFTFGMLVAVLNGLIFPAFSIFLSKMLGSLVLFSTNPTQARTDTNLYALIFLLLAIAAFILNVLQQTIFTNIGESMTEKLRNQTYIKILKMPISWFDKPKNASGSLSARLASDCQTVNSLVTTFFSILVQSLTTLIAGVIIALIFEWRTALVAIGLLPIIVFSGVIQMSFSQGFSDKNDKAYKDSSNLITESMNHIRTVNSFGSEDIIERKYDQKLIEPMAFGVKKGLISGFMYGITQISMFFIFGLVFYLGIIFLVRFNLEVENVFTAIYAILFCGMTAGNNGHFMPDAAAAKNSAANIFQIQDGMDQDQLQVESGSKMLKTPINGQITFKNVHFKYETRDQKALDNLNFSIKRGQKVGFVGPSGCGKSTTQQLMQRFYDPTQGQILIDGVNIKDYDIHYLRANLGVVSQEPILFNQTILENIRYNRKETNQEEIVAAANESNFNPEQEILQGTYSPQKKTSKKKKKADKDAERNSGTGFQKNVGVKGSHISGGQKQRVAIARVILRQPNVLLLDEATSALDSQNEKKVQDSLDRMMQGKTSVTIAHRIDTIKNADQILVFHLGKLMQSGTFQNLMDKRGYFYNLEKGLQNL